MVYDLSRNALIYKCISITLSESNMLDKIKITMLIIENVNM